LEGYRKDNPLELIEATLKIGETAKRYFYQKQEINALIAALTFLKRRRRNDRAI